MEENLLLPEEIQAILKEARKPRYWLPNTISLGRKKTSIFKHSLSTGLIIVWGNADTGMDHIYQRHHFGRQVWNPDRDTLNKSSEFGYGVAPYRYISIAESVYKPQNLRPDLNIRPDMFELYLGTHEHVNGDSVEYKLLTYKETGIIHTLYPTKSAFPRNKLFKYKQGGIGYKYNVMQGQHTYKVPYFDKSSREVFRILVRGQESYPLERWYIQTGEGNDVNPQTVFIKEIVLPASAQHGFLREVTITDSDKHDMEQAALHILAGEFKYQKDEDLHIVNGRPDPIGPTYFRW